tara:strand:+ start:75347 stop:75460 length:114 start_codon:yes stop_codon:yes gene_type:complete
MDFVPEAKQGQRKIGIKKRIAVTLIFIFASTKKICFV